MTDNKNDMLEDQLKNLRKNASYEAPSRLEARVLDQIERKKLPFALRLAPAAVLVFAVFMGGLYYGRWDPIDQATYSKLQQSNLDDSQVRVEAPLEPEEKPSASKKSVVLHPKKYEKLGPVTEEKVMSMKPKVPSESRGQAGKLSSAPWAPMAQESRDEAFDLSASDEMDKGAYREDRVEAAQPEQRNRSAKKAKLAAVPSAAMQSLFQGEANDRQKILESWIEILQRKEFLELDRQLDQITFGTKSDLADQGKTGDLFSKKEISDWRRMLKNRRHDLLEQAWMNMLAR